MSSVIHRKGQRESKVDARTIRDDEIESAFVVPPGTVQSAEPAEPDAAVEFTGRNVVIPTTTGSTSVTNSARLERFDPGIFRFDVRLSHERKPQAVQGVSAGGTHRQGQGSGGTRAGQW